MVRWRIASIPICGCGSSSPTPATSCVLLAAIQGYAELTRQDGSDLPPTTEYALARIESEARRMTLLVDELLLLSVSARAKI